MHADTIDKVVKTYLAAVTAKPFTYQGATFRVPTLTVSPNLLRGYTCPPGCGGCCPVFSLDYLPTEPHPYQLERREIELSGRKVEIFTDRQKENKGDRCRNLNRATGRCNIHESRPFSCDFELIRIAYRREAGTAHITQRLFSRGWNMKRTDGGRGAACEITPADPATVADVLRKFSRLDEWARHFGLPTRIGAIKSWVSTIADAPERYPDLVLQGGPRA